MKTSLRPGEARPLGEHVNLAASDPEQTARLAARLAELQDEAKAGAPQPQR
jgi:hypothetical protein